MLTKKFWVLVFSIPIWYLAYPTDQQFHKFPDIGFRIYNRLWIEWKKKIRNLMEFCETMLYKACSEAYFSIIYKKILSNFST